MSVHERTAKVAAVIESLERDMELLCVTGVEDKLHDGVRTTLELLRNAGIRVSSCSRKLLLKWRFVNTHRSMTEISYFLLLLV